MAAVGGMLASAVIKVVIGQIGFAIGDEIKLHKNMKKNLQNMKMTLESVEAVLSDAETRSVTDKSALLWLERLKDAMYDISDMLDDFEADTDMWAATMHKIEMPRKMKKMQKRLTDDRNDYHVLPETRSEEKQVPDIRETAGNVEEAEIIGRADEKWELLAYQMCWDILKVKSNFETRHDKEFLEPIGKEIANKCGGVALAAQSLGHMLKSKTYDVWDSIRSNHIWNLPASKETSSTHEVLASLLLRFNFMTPHLKLCFAYCAIFPKGYMMISDDLIHQWIALGFVEPSSTFSTWQLGQGYIYITNLLEMSFLQHSTIDIRYVKQGKDATRFIMHDLVHDLARSVMANEYNLEGPNCRYAWLTDCSKPLNSSTKSPEKIRSLHFADKVSNNDAFSPAKHIRVLDLSINSRHDLTFSIGELKQLRYLSFSGGQAQINPRCIGMLSKLNYLRISSGGLRVLPESIGEMKGLIHLDLSGCWDLKELPLSFAKIRELVYLDLSGCRGVSGIPKALGGLTKLQHLDLSACKSLRGLPDAIVNLTELRYLNLSKCFQYIFDNSRDQTESFIDRICTLPNMKQLDLSENKYPLIIPDSASHLTKLVLDGCCRIIRFPECVSNIDDFSYFGVRR